ncbi:MULTISPECIES: helix-turn-helix domain-containing protein [Burkholderiales]|uniref:helix-turn-helix domain-containing protein n=1 Tax=Burkholderiales TaxID=80840 RepID=UPI0011B1F31A|nr:helix-turn-helix domain-containing protein [Achromobacter pulmonis]
MQRSAPLFSAGHAGTSLAYLSSLYPPALSVAQVAEITSEAPQTIRNRLSKGSKVKYPIPSFKVGRKRVFRLIDVAAFIDQQCAEDPSNPANLRPRRGRPTKAEQIAKRQALANAPQAASPTGVAGGAQ